MQQPAPHTNNLILASSPYLLQHAHNPVEWHSWDQSVLDRAVNEDKLILVSIGYSACHWCHVMAHECFEDPEVAGLMNDHFINIKVDREERPDVDHFFMTAVQLMGGQGGWPLNVVALPDGQPVWGGTYFPKDQWMAVLEKIHQLFINERDKLTHHAHNVTAGIEQTSIIGNPKDTGVDVPGILNRAIDNMRSQWDMKEGGLGGAPKFPLPVHLEFLMHLHHHYPQEEYRQYLTTTLDHMAAGGIYDHIGGGFARYAVDAQWKVPHFEKMLYDNAQLISLYAKAFSVWGTEAYQEVVHESADFIERELTHSTGAFFSSLDADSDGEEGRFYVWTEDELKELLGSDFPVFADCFGINEKGYWENGRYVLNRTPDMQTIASQHGMDFAALRKKINQWKATLFHGREKRTRPGLDDKVLTSWNALMTTGLCDAFKALGDEKFRRRALKNGEFLAGELLASDGSLKHTWKEGKASVDGFMEDYATTVNAFVNLYEISGQEEWINRAEKIAQYAIDNFYDEEVRHFSFARKEQKELPAGHFETQDNVVPSSDSMMGFGLTRLAMLTGEKSYQDIAEKMLSTMYELVADHPSGFANWGSLMLLHTMPRYEVVAAGDEEAAQTLKTMQARFRPEVIWAPLLPHSTGNLPVVKDRRPAGNSSTLIYVCSQGACQLPVRSVEEAEQQLSAL
ncbi:MAG: thioredoxin domain-containing protein [Marinilabiliaceae bacterium]